MKSLNEYLIPELIKALGYGGYILVLSAGAIALVTFLALLKRRWRG